MSLRKFATLIALTFAAAACEEDPFVIRWEESPRETLLYSLDREEMFRPSAFDMLQREEIILEAADAEAGWDFAVDRQGGQMVLLPPRLLGIVSGAGIATMPQTSFLDVKEAPDDPAAFIEDAPVPVVLGNVYVIRTRLQRGTFGETCNYFGKIQPLNIDMELGILYFLHDVSPVCNDPSLIPRN